MVDDPTKRELSEIAVLPTATFRDDPFPYFFGPQALPPNALDQLTALFEQDLSWDRHDSFYHAFFADVTARVSPTLRRRVAARLRQLTGLPLADDVTITAQRMEVGDDIPPHTDRPLLGFEAVRMVLQLDGNGDAELGGVFAVHPDEAGAQTTWSHPPNRGDALAFVMRNASHHSVTATKSTRRTIVFHAQHLGNASAVAQFVSALFADLRYDQLPPVLDPIIAEAETTEAFIDRTREAACVAWALMQWDCAADVVVAGYRSALTNDSLGEAPWPVALARWVSILWTADFDVNAWAAMAARPWYSREVSRALSDAYDTLFGRGLSA